jgi:hypothetical protein
MAMRAMSSMVFVVTLLFLSGCASGPKYSEVAASFPGIKSGEGRIYFYRDANVFGSAIQPDVQLNGEAVGSSIPGGFFFVDRAPGDYEAVLSTEVDRKLTFVLASGEEKYVKMSVTLGVIVYRVFPELVDPDIGRVAIRDLSYTGAQSN